VSVRFDPAPALSGSLRPPPDKSISHRAALIGAMCDGPTRITGYLDSGDTRSTLEAVRALGAGVTEGEPDDDGGLFVEIEGAGLRGAASAAIDVGNSGTLLRILPGWLAGQPSGKWSLAGDESIAQRPVARVAEPLAAMGADVRSANGLPPLEIRAAALHGARHDLPIASAQVKSCLLIAGLLAEGPTAVKEPTTSRDHTERMLAAVGATLSRSGTEVVVEPAERLESGDVAVPGDFSSAAFFVVAALIVGGSEVELREVGINRNRIGLLSILSRMGVRMGGAHEEGKAAMTVHEIREPGPEPIADLRVRQCSLRGVEVGGEEVPAAIDELTLVALLGCFAEGETVVSAAAELRRKESDRIDAVVEGLAGLGAEIEAFEDGFRVNGTGSLRGGRLDSRGDHRMAMLGAVAGIASVEGVVVEGYEAVSISYPRFERDLRSLIPAA
jgi:3-phosphoshikimate 1-carboxyvinyltransferase